MAVALHHQLNATATIGTVLKPSTGVASVSSLSNTSANPNITIPTDTEVTAPTLALLESPTALMHPALRGVKAINIGNNAIDILLVICLF